MCIHRSSVAVLLSCLLLAGCANDFSSSTYERNAVGDINASHLGKVVAKRYVNIEGDNELGAGALAGGVGGALLGSAFGKGQGKVLTGAIGAAAGAGIGHAIQRKATKAQGIEYVIKLDNVAEVVIVQGLDNELQIGQRCRIISAQNGKRSRVIAAQ